jgi:hypothetical protein
VQYLSQEKQAMTKQPSGGFKWDAEAIAATLSTEYGRSISSTEITPVGNPDFKIEVADATLKFHAPCSDGREGFLLISGAGNPHLVARATDNIRIARESVSYETASAILSPAAAGELEGRTFAVWPARHPFDTSNHLRRFIRRHRYAGPVIRWSVALSRETLNSGDPETVREDLRVIAEDAAFPDEMRRDASAATERIDRGVWHPMHCLCHGDFWSGNLLLPGNHPEEPAFHVIDWAGMQPEGYPFVDLSRMLVSLRCSPRFCARSIGSLRRHVGCEKQDVISHVLSSFGRTGQNLEFFPPERFRAKAASVYRFVKNICGSHV